MLRQSRDRGVGGRWIESCRNLSPRNSRGGVGVRASWDGREVNVGR